MNYQRIYKSMSRATIASILTIVFSSTNALAQCKGGDEGQINEGAQA